MEPTRAGGGWSSWSWSARPRASADFRFPAWVAGRPRPTKATTPARRIIAGAARAWAERRSVADRSSSVAISSGRGVSINGSISATTSLWASSGPGRGGRAWPPRLVAERRGLRGIN